MEWLRMTGVHAISLLLAGHLVTPLSVLAESGQAGSPPTPNTLSKPQGTGYQAGTRVHAPGGIASFLIPHGWRGELLDEMAALLLVSDKEPGFLLVFATLHQTEADLAALLAEPQPITDTLVFEPVGTVTRQGNKLTASYVGGDLVGRGLAIVGPAQQGVLFLHGRPRAAASDAGPFLDRLADHVQFDPAPPAPTSR